VIGMDEADAVALGAEFGQEAIFVLTPAARRVVGCTDNRVVTNGMVHRAERWSGATVVIRFNVPELDVGTCLTACESRRLAVVGGLPGAYTLLHAMAFS
jgi:hypothetical protein